MSHNLTQPEEIEIVLRDELENYKNRIEQPSASEKMSGQNGWYAGYIPPFRSASLEKKKI
jgi:hypothetical protein